MDGHMNDMNKTELHKKLCVLLHTTYVNKNADYGDSFAETYNKLGQISALTRISDKYNRLVSLATKNEQNVNYEAIDDTLLDMANYCLLWLIERKQGSDTDET